jgi:hypothetical protein
VLFLCYVCDSCVTRVCVRVCSLSCQVMPKLSSVSLVHLMTVFYDDRAIQLRGCECVSAMVRQRPERPPEKAEKGQ